MNNQPDLVVAPASARPVSLPVAAAVFLALALFHTWPLSVAPARLSLNGNADAQLNEWIISWVAHTLPTHPTRLFEGNIFAPEPRTLAFSEPLVAPALLVAPVRWLGGSPVLAFNLALIAGLTLTALSVFFLATSWTGSSAAGWIAGALATFNVHLLTRLPHLQAAHAWGLPLAWYFADRLADHPRARDMGGLAVVIALTAATSLYWLVFITLILTVVAATSGRVGAIAAMAAAGAIGTLLAAPVLWPYIRFAAEGASRPLELVAQLATTPSAYLSSASRLYHAWSARAGTGETDVFFPGIGALTLGGLGLGIALAHAGADRRRGIALLAVAAAGVLLSFGPATPIYTWLYRWYLPLRGLRTAARFGYLPLLALAIAAAYGWVAIERLIRAPRVALGLAAGVLAVVTAEVWQGPVRTMPFTGIPRLYSLLADVPGPVLLAEVPFYLPAEVFQNGEYVLNSTGHWRPLMNGYSGYTPMSYRMRADTLWLFPSPYAFDTLQRAGATHVMVHLERFGTDAAAVAKALEGRGDVQLIGADREGHRLYALVKQPERGVGGASRKIRR